MSLLENLQCQFVPTNRIHQLEHGHDMLQWPFFRTQTPPECHPASRRYEELQQAAAVQPGFRYGSKSEDRLTSEQEQNEPTTEDG